MAGAAAALTLTATAGAAKARPFEADHRFGDRGSVLVDLGQSATATETARDGGGLLIAANTPAWSAEPEDGALVRVTSDGRLDKTFGDGGIVDEGLGGYLHDFALDRSRGLIFALLDQGKIIALDSDGIAVPDWGEAGSMTVGFNATSLALDPDGGVFVAGDANDAPTEDEGGNEARTVAIVQRLDPEGNIDPNYGVGGAFRDTRSCVVIRILRCPQGLILDSAPSPDGSLTIAGAFFPPCGGCPSPSDDYVRVLGPTGDIVESRPPPEECESENQFAQRVASAPSGEPFVTGACLRDLSYLLRPLLPEDQTYGSESSVLLPDDYQIRDLTVDSRQRALLALNVSPAFPKPERPGLLRFNAKGEVARGFDAAHPFRPRLQGVDDFGLTRLDHSRRAVLVAGFANGGKRLLVARLLDRTGRKGG